MSNPNVRYIEPDAIMTADHVQTSAPWHLDRIDQRSLPLDGLYHYFWTGGGSDVSIYTIDSGIREGLAEFGNRLVGPGYTAVHDGKGTDDCYNHGTEVASVAAGSAVGVAKEAWIWPVRVLDCDGNALNSQVIAGIDWVAGHHFKPAVANMSMSNPQPPGCTNPQWWLPCGRTIEDAVQGLVAAGVVVVTSAGQTQAGGFDFAGSDACGFTPNRMAEAITVAATDSVDARARWTETFNQPWSSNWGSCVDIWAPGKDVLVVDTTGNAWPRSGTSYASPAVAGAIALILDEHPSFTVQQATNLLHSRATWTTIGDAKPGSPHRLVYAPSFSLFIGGESVITEAGPYQWSAATSGGGHHSPDSYLWEYRPDHDPSWQVVGTSATYGRNVTPGDPNFWLRVTVSVGTFQVMDVKDVTVVCDDPLLCPD